MQQYHWAPVGALFALLTGCGGEDFAPFGRLTSLRVLGIQSEPVAPGPGETTTLTPLVYVPPQQDEPKFQWSWCPVPGSADEGYPCLMTAEQLAASAPGITLPPTDLGTGPTATFDNSIDPAVLGTLCSGDEAERLRLDCSLGFPVQIKVIATSSQAEIVAVRTLYLRFSDKVPSNKNPSFSGLEVKLEGQWHLIDESLDAKIRRDKETELRARISDEQSESYLDSSPGQKPQTKREQLSLAWFVESGSTRSEHTSFIAGRIPIDNLNSNRWSPGRREDYEPNTSDIILVLRDDREGVAWQRFSVSLTEQP